MFAKKEERLYGIRVLDVELVNQEIQNKDENAVKKVDKEKIYTKENE